MNSQDRAELNLLKGEVKEMHTTIEIIKTNDLPHIDMKADAAAGMAHEASLTAASCLGALKVLVPLVVIILGLIAGLYFM